MNILYDCAGAATTPLPGPGPLPTVTMTASVSGFQPVPLGNWLPISYVEVTPICPGFSTRCTSPTASLNGVVEASFYRDYDLGTLPANAVVTVAFSNCCRNSSISSGAADESIYLATQITPGLGINSSPQFLSLPAAYICAGMPYLFSQGAFDADGDSLVYSLTSAYQDPTLPVTYAAGFSPLQPLGPTWNCSIDAQTGDLSLLPNPVGAQVTAVMGIRVEEYRNGVLLGAVMRDFQIVVIPCPWVGSDPVISGLSNLSGALPLTGNTVRTLPGTVVEFDLQISDADTTQSLSAFPMYTPGAVVAVTQVGTSQNPLQVHVTVNTPTNMSQPLTVRVAATDNLCPLPRTTTSAPFIIIPDTTALLVSAITAGTPCDSAVGSIDLTATGLFPPLQYLWNTGDTTQDLSGLASGVYTVVVSDQAGNQHTDSFTVQGFDLNLAVMPTWNACLPGAGSLTALTTGGIPPVTYLWNTGDTTAALSGLNEGIYQVTAVDSAGCLRKETLMLERPDSCLVKLIGQVYFDLNADCVRDSLEAGIPYKYVDVTPGGGIFTDINGTYTLIADTGAITLRAWAPLQPSWCSADSLLKHPVNYGINFIGNDFARYDSAFVGSASNLYDLVVNAWGAPARPGNTSVVWITISNTSAINGGGGTLTYQHDPLFSYIGASPATAVYDSVNHIVTWGISPALNAWQYQTYALFLNNPATTALGSPYQDSIWIIPNPMDSVLANNHCIIRDTVVASYDPNIKTVSPKGYWGEGFIPSSDSVLTYTIHFQNTGTDTAFFVTLRDTLDTDLDLKRYQHLGSSFPYTLRVEGDNILVFRFDHINLPDSGRDEAGSHGFVSFTLPFKHPAQGVQVSNRAAIYFDFNAPIITNTVKNTICDPVQATFTATLLPDGGWQLMPEMHFANDWHWDFGPFGTSSDSIPAPLYLPDSGNYPIRLVASNWCSDEQTLLLIQQDPNQINGSYPVGMSILPNPAQEMARIRITAAVPTVTITDVAGRILRTLPVTNGEATFVRGDLPAGMYYVRAVAADGRAAAMMMVLEP